ncbi:MAG: Rieske 2Fe-2S domain-containing protein [Bryobacterales bacterium]|nr:Rieske 2Fe-2S domain-containing protein [Bryobacterales bacterium]
MREKPASCPREARLWREEFSVAAGEQGFVERRQFGKFLVLTSAAMFAGQLWLLAKNAYSKRAGGLWPRKAVALERDLAIGEAKVFAYPGPQDNCLLIRLGEERFVAYSQKCTHLSCAVVYSAQRRRLECPCHEGYFSVEDGYVIQGPPPRPLPRIELERSGGQLYARGVTVFGEEESQ